MFGERGVTVPFKKSLTIGYELERRIHMSPHPRIGEEIEIRLAVAFLPDPMNYTRECAPARSGETFAASTDELVDERQNIEIRKRQSSKIVKEIA